MAENIKINNQICYFLVLFILIISAPNAQAIKSLSVGVIFPDIREPYRSIFMDIIGGIEKQLGFSVHRYTVSSKNSEPELLNKWITKNQIQIVIALGKQGVDQAKALPQGMPVIAGAILEPADREMANISGITLAPDPYELFDRLRKLVPEIKRVTIVYSDKHNGWIIDYAKSAAAKFGLELKVFEATNLVEAASLYRKILESDLSISDAIWLSQDNITVDSKTILPLLLKEAWDRNFIVFSSNPSDVKRGVLFSLYPDNNRMGVSLGELAIGIVTNKPRSSQQFIPLKDLLIAVNIRTAEHLGLKLSQMDINNFNLVFPAPH